MMFIFLNEKILNLFSVPCSSLGWVSPWVAFSPSSHFPAFAALSPPSVRVICLNWAVCLILGACMKKSPVGRDRSYLDQRSSLEIRECQHWKVETYSLSKQRRELRSSVEWLVQGGKAGMWRQASLFPPQKRGERWEFLWHPLPAPSCVRQRLSVLPPGPLCPAWKQFMTCSTSRPL